MISFRRLRQQQLLTLLLQNKEGLSVEDLSKGLGITDNAVRQHLTTLERDGMVAKGETQSTGGRPEHLYGLTIAGQELFPRHYSWFAELLINSLREEQGTDALRERLEGMGKAVGRQVAARLAGVKDRRERIRALADIMRELGYQSGSIDPAKEKWPAIEATNCVFHNLAKCYPEVCHFDLTMMSEVVGWDVVHDECMVRGSHVSDSNSKNADRSLAQSEICTLCWRWFAERPFSSNTAILQSRTTCLAGNDTNPLHNPMIPSVIVLEYGLVIYKIYKANGFSGDQPWKSLRQDIRAVPRFEVDLRGAGTRRTQRNLPRSGCRALELVAGKHCQYDTATRNCTL